MTDQTQEILLEMSNFINFKDMNPTEITKIVLTCYKQAGSNMLNVTEDICSKIKTYTKNNKLHHILEITMITLSIKSIPNMEDKIKFKLNKKRGYHYSCLNSLDNNISEP